MNSHLKKYAPLKTEHQSSLHPWVSRKTSPNQKSQNSETTAAKTSKFVLDIKNITLRNQITPMIEIDQQFAKLY